MHVAVAGSPPQAIIRGLARLLSPSCSQGHATQRHTLRATAAWRWQGGRAWPSSAVPHGGSRHRAREARLCGSLRVAFAGRAVHCSVLVAVGGAVAAGCSSTAACGRRRHRRTATTAAALTLLGLQRQAALRCHSALLRRTWLPRTPAISAELSCRLCCGTPCRRCCSGATRPSHMAVDVSLATLGAVPSPAPVQVSTPRRRCRRVAAAVPSHIALIFSLIRQLSAPCPRRRLCTGTSHLTARCTVVWRGGHRAVALCCRRQPHTAILAAVLSHSALAASCAAARHAADPLAWRPQGCRTWLLSLT